MMKDYFSLEIREVYIIIYYVWQLMLKFHLCGVSVYYAMSCTGRLYSFSTDVAWLLLTELGPSSTVCTPIGHRGI